MSRYEKMRKRVLRNPDAAEAYRQQLLDENARLQSRVKELEGALRAILEAQGAIYNTIDDQFEGVMAAVDKAESLLTTTEEPRREE